MEEIKLYTHEEVLDRMIGTESTPAYEEYKTDINNSLIGEAIKWAGEAKNFTQEQLDEFMGVKRAQVLKIESRKSISFSTTVRAFKTMGMKTASLELGSLGKVALW